MNDILKIIRNSVHKACEPLGDAWNLVTGEHDQTIVDHYKGMEIRVQARRFGLRAWRCSIRIGNAPHQALQSVVATLQATDDGVSRQTALLGGFMEAMALCDLLLEKRPVQ